MTGGTFDKEYDGIRDATYSISAELADFDADRGAASVHGRSRA